MRRQHLRLWSSKMRSCQFFLYPLDKTLIFAEPFLEVSIRVDGAPKFCRNLFGIMTEIMTKQKCKRNEHNFLLCRHFDWLKLWLKHSKLLLRINVTRPHEIDIVHHWFIYNIFLYSQNHSVGAKIIIFIISWWNGRE